MNPVQTWQLCPTDGMGHCLVRGNHKFLYEAVAVMALPDHDV